jgi:NAD(P)-dependent dehydrogenase (short-subunit alcohol dehydrogenase family)
MDMKNKVAIVYGGGAGLGRACAELYARNGASVVIADVSVEAGHAAVDAVRASGGTAEFSLCDVQDEDQVAATVHLAVETFGGLDYAVNNVGTNLSFVPTAETSTATWDRVVDINLRSIFLCLKHEVPAMLGRQGGAIVNITSSGGVHGIATMSPYTATKHGVIGLTKTAALEYACQGVRVNAVAPGHMLSDGMKAAIAADPDFAKSFEAEMPIGRLCTADEVAKVVVWLTSDESGIVNGAVVPADGGLLAG